MTLFSAPNYCGEFDNAGGMMSVDETLMCSFQVCSFVLFLFKWYSGNADIVTGDSCSDSSNNNNSKTIGFVSNNN